MGGRVSDSHVVLQVFNHDGKHHPWSRVHRIVTDIGINNRWNKNPLAFRNNKENVKIRL